MACRFLLNGAESWAVGLPTKECTRILCMGRSDETDRANKDTTTAASYGLYLNEKLLRGLDWQMRSL